MEANIEAIEINIEAIQTSIHNISIGTVTTVPNLPDDTHGEATAAYEPLDSKLWYPSRG